MNLSQDVTKFSSISRKIKTNNGEDGSNVLRKLVALNHYQSVKSLDNASACCLLENNLKKYCDNFQENNLKIQEKITNTLAHYNIKTPVQLTSNLTNVDLKSMLPQHLCCSSELDNQDVAKFKQLYSKNKPEFAEVKQKRLASSFVPQTCNKNVKPLKVLNTTEECTSEQSGTAPTNYFRTKREIFYGTKRNGNNKTNDNNENIEETTNSRCSFKTAAEELQMQTRTFNRPTIGGGSLGGQKRKLGIRRNVSSQFVSPLITNDRKEEVIGSKIINNEVIEEDERLKNIDPKMVELIRSEIMDIGTQVEWNDIAGLEFAKNAIQEAVVYPMLRPDIFTGLRRPPKGILLFGPPGTGKTLIGKCVASQSKSTFFSISASSLTSKWIGEGEKMVRALFTVARCHQPAIIFIDEIDSLLCQRSESEHESSRRIKTEFLVQLDGATTDGDERILLIGATNRPQELDEAARRRFVKRLYIPLPEFEARLQLVSRLLSNEKHHLTQSDFAEIAKLSEGYSGADIKNLCSEASLGPIRSIDMKTIERILATDVRPLTMQDFRQAFERIRSSVAPSDLNQYLIWDKTYGSGL